MRHAVAGVILLTLTLAAGCCATCHHSLRGLPGAVYGESPHAVCHPGPLSWLWRLLGIGRGYPCDDCGPRYWGDWGGDPAGCEACDDYGQWVGTPIVTSRPGAMPSSERMMRTTDCPECTSANSPQDVTQNQKSSSSEKTSLAPRPDERTNPRR